MFIATGGLLFFKLSGVGERAFSQSIGFVSFGWLLYAGLFVTSLLWYETLVWIGVRQVRYANAWPDAQPAHDVQEAH